MTSLDDWFGNLKQPIKNKQHRKVFNILLSFVSAIIIMSVMPIAIMQWSDFSLSGGMVVFAAFTMVSFIMRYVGENSE